MMQAGQIAIAPKKVPVIPHKRLNGGRYDELVKSLNLAYASGDHESAIKTMLTILDAVGNEQRAPGAIVGAEIQRAVHAVLSVFTAADLRIPESQAMAFLFNCPVIANALSAAVDSAPDAWRACVAGDKQEAFKACVLSSPREEVDFPFDKLMDASPELASAWFCQTFKTAFAGNVDERVRTNLIRLARSLDSRFVACRDMQEPYFLVTYLGDDEAEQNVKQRINEAIKRTATTIKPGKASRIIAVASDNWMPGHSVWRTLKGYVDALRPDFDLVLIHCLREADVLDTDGFKEVIKLEFDGTTVNYGPLQDCGFAGLIIPDVGMTGWSISLANHRVAPVQVMMTGHPVSTFGSEIDYFISGELTGEPTEPYSEDVIRLPGFGAIHEHPTYKPVGTAKTFDGILINCSWYGQKITHEWVEFVSEIIRHSGRDVKLQIFAGGAATSRAGFSPFLRSIDRALSGVKAELFPHLDYAEYMGKMEAGDFAIDCYPFAGSNTVSDNLHLRKPVVCLEGDRWFNRIGPAMLRSCGMGDMVARTPDDFATVLTRMITDDDYRADFTNRLARADLAATVYRRQGAAEFAKWMADRVGSLCT
jgi:hypothetical protein